MIGAKLIMIFTTISALQMGATEHELATKMSEVNKLVSELTPKGNIFVIFVALIILPTNEFYGW